MQKANLSLEDLNAKLSDLEINNSDLTLLNNTMEKSKENYSKLSQDLFAAKEDLKKAEAIYAENAISKAEYDKYVVAVNNLNSSLKTAELNLKDANVNYNNKQEQKTLDKLSLERQIENLTIL